jgi:vacuolar-type H+-ATPase subunit I/STV1
MPDRETESVNKMVDKTPQIFRRILGLFLLLYGFLVLSQPSQYGLGFSHNFTPLIGFGFILVGLLLVLYK